MLPAAISAIDVALHEVKGKTLVVPVYQLLGGKHRDWVSLFATTHAPMGPKLLNDAGLLIGQGWNTIRNTMHESHELNEVGENVDERWEGIGTTAHGRIKSREAFRWAAPWCRDTCVPRPSVPHSRRLRLRCRGSCWRWSVEAHAITVRRFGRVWGR